MLCSFVHPEIFTMFFKLKTTTFIRRTAWYELVFDKQLMLIADNQLIPSPENFKFARIEFLVPENPLVNADTSFK